MKRDMDLVRLILIRTENHQFGSPSASELEADGYDKRTIAQHIELLEEAGLLRANLFVLEAHGAVDGNVERLTWAGHEYLSAVRNDTVWLKTKTLVAEKLGSAPLEIFKAIAVKFALQHVGIGGG